VPGPVVLSDTQGRGRMRARRSFGIALTAAVFVLLAGCVPAPAEGGDSPSPDPDPTPSETASAPSTSVPVFEQPKKCVDIITPETAAAFAADGLDLLGGPGGKYGGDYFAEDTSEEQAGGITCVWGDEDVLASTVVISVAPVSTATRAGIVDDLISQGLIESQIEGALTYAQIGDETSTQGILNVIRSDSWISVIEALGGEERFQRATELVDEVTALVYVEP
jgi:hypothetical protein